MRPHGLPQGVVTFLLTDVVGSTAAWETDRTLMAATMTRHDAILSDAAQRHGGVRPLEQGEGDSMVLAFTTASDALKAALEAQIALRHEDCAVRMAVHTGEALVRFDVDSGAPRYAGRAVITAARLRSLAHGGQVLVSAATQALVGGDLPSGATTRDLGVVVLRGLVNPQPVFQLVHADLDETFPPLHSLVSVPHTVPVAASSFLGREADLEELANLISAQRLVTITGTGGVGKTRLAQQVILEHIDVAAGGAWWVELAPATTVEGVLAATAQGMNHALQPGTPAATQFTARLRGDLRTVLVFDNCEHVVELVGDLVARLLADVSNLNVVVTSREPLGLPGEHVWRVASLAVPPLDRSLDEATLLTFDAARLFVERARAARPNLVVDPDSAQHIASICCRLDGVALAIELAAARSRAMPLDTLAQALDNSFRLLTGGSRTLLPRQQTLLASISWSVDLLRSVEQTTLRRLSVCPGWFDLDAAEAVVADEYIAVFEVLDSLIALVDKSLIDFDATTGSYRIMETIRQFGLERLQLAGEVAASRRRHATHWAQRVGTMQSWQLDLTAFVHSEITDIFAMLDWSMNEDPPMAERALAAAGWIYGFGRWDELPRTCEFLAADRPRSSEWPAAVATVGLVAPLAGSFQLLALMPEAVAVAQGNADRRALQLLDVSRAYLALASGDPGPGLKLFDEAVADGHTAAAFYAGTGVAIHLAVLGHLTDAERICGWVGDLTKAGITLTRTAAGVAMAQIRTARGQFQTVDDIPSRVDSWPMVSNGFALCAAMRAAFTGSQSWLELAQGLRKGDLGEWGTTTHRYVEWAAAVVAGDDELALWATDDGAYSPTAVSWPVDMARPTTLIALGRWGDALSAIERLEQVQNSLEMAAPLPMANLAVTRARIAVQALDRATGEAAAHRALQLAIDGGFRLVMIDALEALAALSLLADEPVRAARLAGAATADRDRCGYVSRLWSALSLSAIADLSGAEPEAWRDGESMTLADTAAWARRQRGPRGRPSFGAGSLTPTEQLVAERIATGQTNAEIADALLVSVATVKTHVTRIFTKFGVRNRTELAAALER